MDQASQLRQRMLCDSLSARAGVATPRLVAVTGGKGGVGTTTLAIQLALALVRDGRRTVLVDAAGESGDLARQCDLPQNGSVQDVLAGRRDLHEVLQSGPGGLLIAPAESQRWRTSPTSEHAALRLIAQLAELGRYADYVVLDAGRGLEHGALPYLRRAESTLLVTTPDNLGVMDSYALLKQCVSPGGSWQPSLVVNRAEESQGRDAHARLALACRRFLGWRLELAGVIPQLGPLSPRMPRGDSAWDRLAARVVESLAAPCSHENLIHAG